MESPEEEPIKMKREDFDELRTLMKPMENPERLALMERFGISFDSGVVKLELENGEKQIGRAHV